MKTKLVTAVALVAGLLAVCGPALAHHGDAAYNMTKLVELKNVKVTKIQWGNPHILLFFDATDKNGNVAHWVAETGSPSAVASQGWTSGTVQPGNVIPTLYLNQAKDGRTIGRLSRFVLANGKQFGDTDVSRYGKKHSGY